MDLKKILLVISLVAIGLLWWSDSIEVYLGSRARAHSKTDINSTLTQEELAAVTPGSTPNPSPTPIAATQSAPAVEASEGQRAENLKNLLSQMTTCLGIASAGTGVGDATYANLMDLLKSDLGEALMKSEDWSNTYLQAPNGELRKIRLETDFGDEKISRRLKYYSINQDGALTPIEMAAEQLNDPSDSLLASLESGNEIALRELASRTYFQNGEEITAIEKNNLLNDVEIVRAAKTLHCEGMSSPEAKCRCQ